MKDLVTAGNQLQALNRAFGTLLQEVQAVPQVVIVVLQGAVLGGGFGLACVSDIAIADHQAQFGLPETSLGLLPAQIAPFVVKRIGLTQARRLALTAAPTSRASPLPQVAVGNVGLAPARPDP